MSVQWLISSRSMFFIQDYWCLFCFLPHVFHHCLFMSTKYCRWELNANQNLRVLRWQRCHSIWKDTEVHAALNRLFWIFKENKTLFFILVAWERQSDLIKYECTTAHVHKTNVAYSAALSLAKRKASKTTDGHGEKYKGTCIMHEMFFTDIWLMTTGVGCIITSVGV